MAVLKTGKPDTTPDGSSHVEGIPQGNEKGNFEKMVGHLPDGRVTAARSTGVNPDGHNPIDPRMPNLPPA